MGNNEIEQALKNILVEKWEMDVENLYEFGYLEDLGIDSIKKIMFIKNIEEQFDIQFNGSEIAVSKIDDLVHAIQKKIEGPN